MLSPSAAAAHLELTDANVNADKFWQVLAIDDPDSNAQVSIHRYGRRTPQPAAGQAKFYFDESRPDSARGVVYTASDRKSYRSGYFQIAEALFSPSRELWDLAAAAADDTSRRPELLARFTAAFDVEVFCDVPDRPSPPGLSVLFLPALPKMLSYRPGLLRFLVSRGAVTVSVAPTHVSSRDPSDQSLWVVAIAGQVPYDASRLITPAWFQPRASSPAFFASPASSPVAPLEALVSARLAAFSSQDPSVSPYALAAAPDLDWTAAFEALSVPVDGSEADGLSETVEMLRVAVELWNPNTDAAYTSPDAAIATAASLG